MSSQELDQQIAAAADFMPTFWHALYQSCLRVGFNERQAFSLIQTYILGQNPNGIRPQDLNGPESNG